MPVEKGSFAFHGRYSPLTGVEEDHVARVEARQAPPAAPGAQGRVFTRRRRTVPPSAILHHLELTDTVHRHRRGQDDGLVRLDGHPHPAERAGENLFGRALSRWTFTCWVRLAGSISLTISVTVPVEFPRGTIEDNVHVLTDPDPVDQANRHRRLETACWPSRTRTSRTCPGFARSPTSIRRSVTTPSIGALMLV